MNSAEKALKIYKNLVVSLKNQTNVSGYKGV